MKPFQELNKSFIDGRWVQGESKRTYEIKNPYDQSLITSVPLATAQQLEESYILAKKAQKQWATTPAEEKRDVLHKAMAYIKEHKEAIIEVIVHETGGSMTKANVEVDLTLSIMEEALNMPEEIENVDEEEASIEGKINHIHRLPLGVITSISPFNFPLNLSMRTIAPAIALGNSVVHKPDIQTALTGGSIITSAFEHAGLPKGVLNVILTDLDEIGDDMLTTPHSHLISFTGSTPVGKHINEMAGSMLKRVALELGGNNPFLVLSDADVDHAVEAAIFGKFIHQGQICMIINRIIVHQDQYEAFVEKFIERTQSLPVGDPRDPDTIVGPLINEEQANQAMEIIEQAKQDGATVALEGKQDGNLISPYVFTDVDNSSDLAQTELFAPIATIIKAEDDEQAIEMANDTEMGLSSAIFTNDLERGQRLALQIESGMTHINDQTVNDSPTVPFGGHKESGKGRFGNPWVVDKFTMAKWVSTQTEYRDFPF